MSNGEVRKVSLHDIQLVQNLIERCLQLYMSQREVVSILLHLPKIEPGFTELVWQKLEAENQEFFRGYHLRLLVKDQILQFNQLLERQVELMRRRIRAELFPLLCRMDHRLIQARKHRYQQSKMKEPQSSEGARLEGVKLYIWRT